MARKGLPGPLRLPIIILALSFIILSRPDTASITAAEPATSEADILQEFKATLSDGGGDEALRSWTSGSTPCSENHSTWTGVICINGKVWGLQLENMNLSGQLTVAALGRLPSLRAISFMNNDLVGPFPDIRKLGALKALYLSNNQLSEEIPDDAFAETRSLKKVYLENNEFTGKIPSSLTLLSKLMMLRLDNNQFQGEIPDLKQPNLMMLNVANNKLEGRIPDSLSSIDRNAFKGNGKLCGRPIDTCEAPHMSRASLIGFIVGCIVAVLIILLLIFCLCCRGDRDRDRDRDDDTTYHDHPSAAAGSKARSSDATDADRLEQGSSASGSGGSTGGGRRGSRDSEHGKLFFIREERERERFELQDLLRASAEVLGSGNFGSSYKAVLINGPSVVVKRFKDMNRVGREEFQEHMRRLGRLSHPNVLPLVAYYYKKEEKLIITNYILNGSLAHMLHGNRGSNLPPLEWPTRLKIIKGVARGLAYLYEELPMLTLPHGHLKSSNVLIDDNYEALLTDYALMPVVNQSHASQVMVAYKSPEVAGTGKPSKKSDVWSLGILILEVMTGKFPSTYLQKGKGGTDDLTEWVESVAKEGEEVFDSEMNKTKSGQGQMSKLLQIGLGCCEANADKRWVMKEALDRIEELKEMEIDDDDSTVLSEVELGSSH